MTNYQYIQKLKNIKNENINNGNINNENINNENINELLANVIYINLESMYLVLDEILSFRDLIELNNIE